MTSNHRMTIFLQATIDLIPPLNGHIETLNSVKVHKLMLSYLKLLFKKKVFWAGNNKIKKPIIFD